MLTRAKETSRQVRAFLEEVSAYNLLDPLDSYMKRCRANPPENGRAPAAVTYHAVSALGSGPDEDEQLTSPVMPVNCVDPLSAALSQIVTSAGS